MPDGAKSRKHSRVLIIDDEKNFEEDYSELLKPSSRHEFVASKSAEAGLEQLRDESEEFDLVIVDYELNDGWSAPKFIEKAKHIRPIVPYAIWSTYNEATIRSELDKLPIDNLLKLTVSAYATKKEVLSRAANLEKFVARAIDEFQEFYVSQFASALQGAYQKVELALSDVTYIRQKLDQNIAAGRFQSEHCMKPARLKAIKTEQRLRQLLSYKHVEPLISANDYSEAMHEITRESFPEKFQSVLQRSVSRNELSEFSRSAFHKLLRDIEPDQTKTEEFADSISELISLLISAGKLSTAHILSELTWKIANESWPLSSRTLCAINHAQTLSACGERELAEQLVASALLDIKSNSCADDFAELVRATLAEIDESASSLSTKL